MWLRTLTAQRQPRRNPDVERQPVEPAELFGAALHGRRNRRDIRDVDDVGKGLAALGRDLRHRAVGSFLVDIDASHCRALAREQHRHCTAISNRRLFVNDLALTGADHDDAAARQPHMTLGLSQRFGVQGSCGIDIFRRAGGGGHGCFLKSALLGL
jgi:hypothetical protein